MTKLEERAKNLVKELVPDYSNLEFRASIGDRSHSIEFFVMINGKRWQCYEFADDGKIDEKKMEKLFDDYAKFVRKSGEYKAGEVNKVYFSE